MVDVIAWRTVPVIFAVGLRIRLRPAAPVLVWFSRGRCFQTSNVQNKGRLIWSGLPAGIEANTCQGTLIGQLRLIAAP